MFVEVYINIVKVCDSDEEGPLFVTVHGLFCRHLSMIFDNIVVLNYLY